MSQAPSFKWAVGAGPALWQGQRCAVSSGSTAPAAASSGRRMAAGGFGRFASAFGGQRGGRTTSHDLIAAGQAARTNWTPDAAYASSCRNAAVSNCSAAGVSRAPLTRPMRFKVSRATGSQNPAETPSLNIAMTRCSSESRSAHVMSSIAHLVIRQSPAA
jgi:hypothetical protein